MGHQLQSSLHQIVLDFAHSQQITNFEDLTAFGYTPTARPAKPSRKKTLQQQLRRRMEPSIRNRQIRRSHHALGQTPRTYQPRCRQPLPIAPHRNTRSICTHNPIIVKSQHHPLLPLCRLPSPPSTRPPLRIRGLCPGRLRRTEKHLKNHHPSVGAGFKPAPTPSQTIIKISAISGSGSLARQ